MRVQIAAPRERVRGIVFLQAGQEHDAVPPSGADIHRAMGDDDDAGPSSLDAAPSYAGPWTKLKPPLDAALLGHVTNTLQFSQMTPVQSSVIPLFLSHRDVIVEAVTGSGKTLAYVLPVLQMIVQRNVTEENRLRKGQVGALIICPTRELAVQVHGVFDNFFKCQRNCTEEGEACKTATSSALLVVGGSTFSPFDDYARFKEQGSDIIVGTPGRVEELLKRNNVDVKELEVLILDEADRLLDLGFSLTIQTILQQLPKQRRTGLFSATMTDALGELARVGLRNPVRIVVKVQSKSKAGKGSQLTGDRRTPASLQNFYLVCRAESKLHELIDLLRREAFHPDQGSHARKALVYFSTCAQVEYFYKVLSKVEQMKGITLYSLHGQQTSSRRTATFNSFVAALPMGSPTTSNEAASVLLCTDVAARGLDLPNVDLVVQFDPPTDPKVFSHRCGRTARAGRHGRAVVLLCKGREEEYVDFLKVRKSPVQPYLCLSDKEDAAQGASRLTSNIKELIRQDRDLYESSVKAFVSFIKCYKKHEARFIFREQDLDFGKIASSFALLRLPRMPEIDRWRREHRVEADAYDGEDSINMDTFAYADKAREKQRLDGIEKRKTEPANDASEKKSSKGKKKMRGVVASETAWSHQKAQKDRKEERKEKKARKREFEKRQKEEQNAKVDDRVDQDDGADDWAQDEREAKKARKAAVVTGTTFDDL